MTFESANFTGHRPQDLGGFDERDPLNLWVKQALAKCIITCIERYEIREWISGGALGVDQWAAEIVLWLKNHKGYDLNLVIMKPFRSQHLKWNERSQERFLHICEAADEVIECQPDPYAPWKMDFRNKAMVKRGRFVLAVWSGKEGGTFNCVKFAKHMKRPILRINPVTKVIGWERPIE